MNRMYTPVTYFLARAISGTLFQMAYPIIMSLIVFWCFSIEATFVNLILFILCGLGGVFTGCAFGFLIGATFNLVPAANLFGSLCIQYVFLLAGVFVNSNTMDPFNKFLQYISPSKYGTEIYFRIISSKAPDEV